jgi:ketosteroid isomerase-like protein
MPEENVEIVRRATEAAVRRPKPDVETMNALYHPDHEFVSLLERLEGGVAEGARGYRDWLAENDEAWERWEISIERLESLDDERVLLETRFVGLSKRVRMPVEQSTAAMVTVRHGKIVRSELYADREQALEAAGLGE